MTSQQECVRVGHRRLQGILLIQCGSMALLYTFPSPLALVINYLLYLYRSLLSSNQMLSHSMQSCF